MAKKKTTRVRRVYTTRWSGVDVLAFIALIASAALLVVGPIIGWILSGNLGSLLLRIMHLVAQYCLLAAIAIPGWYFVRNKATGWRVVYFVFLVIYIVGTILGVSLRI